jgi:hypothetical protein
MPPAPASPARPRRPADDGAEARQPGAGRVGRAPETVALLLAMLPRDLPVVPAQGSVGASRRPRAARAYGRGDDRRRRDRSDGQALPAERRCGAPASAAAAGPQGRAGAAQRHAVLDRQCAGRPVRGRALFQAALVTGALSTEAPRAPTRRSTPHPRAARPAGPDRVAARCAADGRLGDPRLATATATSACRIPIACAASRR